jgi:PAS domain S-box-containing protein
MSAKTTILIVEDEMLVAKDIRRFLQALDYEVLGIAASAEEAIESALDSRPDLILMDIRLKGEMDGITAAEKIRERLDVPVVFLTAQWDKKTRERAKATGAYGYVLKPWVERELEIGVEMALAIHAKERQVTESEERVRRIMETALDAVVMMDADGIVVDWNPQAENTFGWSRDEALGRPVAELIVPPGYREGHLRGLEIARATGRGGILNKRIEIDALRRDGTVFPVQLAVTPIRSGESCIFSAFIRDITESKRARDALQANETKYRTLVEATNTGYLIIDERGRVIEANAEYIRLSGHLTLNDIRGRSVLEWTVEHLRERHVEEIRKCLESSSSHSFETRYGEADGRSIPIEVNAKGLWTRDGWQIVSLCRDITSRKRHEQQLEEYASAVAHEVKGPVRTMLWCSVSLQRNVQDKLGESELNELQKVSQKAEELKQVCLALEYNENLGRTAAGPVDCNPILSAVRERLRPEIEAAQATIEADSLPTVIADEGELPIVFQNLISNAIKYRADRPLQIHIASQRHGSDWQFSVRDNGIGIDPRKTSEVFQIFKRLKEKEDVEGLGVGLANCKNIIERRGGSIWVKSEPGVGSTFYFTLPAVDDAPAG